MTWRVYPSFHSNDPDPRSYIFDEIPVGDPVLICKVSVNEHAELIAAAPELLQACKALVRVLDEQECPECCEADNVNEILKRARKLIEGL